MSVYGIKAEITATVQNQSPVLFLANPAVGLDTSSMYNTDWSCRVKQIM